MMNLTHLDLFSGIGGFAIAAQANGFETVAFCEIEPYAQQVLIEKFGAVLADASSSDVPERPFKSDQKRRKVVSQVRCCNELRSSIGGNCRAIIHPNIFTLDGTKYRGVDLLTGGFPCQPFSVAGKRRGAEDDRAIWPEMFRVIREAEPAAVVAENVPGIINMELDRCISDLESIGYSVWPIVVPACAVDARHRRDRVWIVANRSGFNGRSRSESRGPWIETSDSREDVANANRPGSQGREREELRECSSERIVGTCDSSMADTESKRESSVTGSPCERILQPVGNGVRRSKACSWLPEPDVGRVAHGVSNRAHRLRALGNAIVPQVAQEIIRCMKEGGVWQPE